METKFCPRCSTTKPVSAFYLNKGRPDGLSGYCVECQRAVETERRHRTRLLLIEDLGGKCVTCGFSDWRALQIDHVNGDGAIDRVEHPNTNSPSFYRAVRANPDRYALVCANCNWIKRHEQGEVIGRRVYVRTEPQEKRQSEGRWSEAANAKRSEAVRRHQAESPEAERVRAEKMRQKTTGRKMVVREGKRTWAYPGDSDYPTPLVSADPIADQMMAEARKTSVPIVPLPGEGFWAGPFNECQGCGEYERDHYGDGLCVLCHPSPVSPGDSPAKV